MIREAKRETFLEGKEYAVIKRKNGKRYLVSGDRLSLDLVNDGKDNLNNMFFIMVSGQQYIEGLIVVQMLPYKLMINFLI